jgi:RNA polymerase sigma-70 factor (ECF subfamily)
MDDSEKQLLERARTGDAQALEALLERHQAQVYRFSMKMCRDPEDAKDILQETLIALARGVREFRATSSLSTWLYTVARNACVKKRRRSKFAPQSELSLDERADAERPELVSSAPGPDDIVDGRDVQHALLRAFERLDPSSREVLVLRDSEGLTAAEVAEVLGISVEAVKSRLHRARVAVRAELLPLIGAPRAESESGCPEVILLFSKYLEGEISAEVCVEMQGHIDRCPACRARCDSLEQTLALCRTAQAAAEVPASVQASVKAALRELLEEGSAAPASREC